MLPPEEEPVARDVIGNPVPRLEFDTPAAPTSRINEQGEFEFAAPLPLPADWKPGFEQSVDVAATATIHAEFEALRDLNVGAQTPYPSKEDNHGTAIPRPDHAGDAGSS